MSKSSMVKIISKDVVAMEAVSQSPKIIGTLQVFGEYAIFECHKTYIHDVKALVPDACVG